MTAEDAPNTLEFEKNYTKEEILEALNKCGFNENVRGEALTLAQFAALADVLAE